MHMNDVYGKNYQISQFLEAIDSNITSFYTPATWGYNMFFYLAASNDCHPNYVSFLMDKRTLSVSSINEILGKLQGEKKLLYDKNYIEQLYKEYQDVVVDDEKDIAALREAFAGREVLMIGPGTSANTKCDAIAEVSDRRKPIVISVNFIPEKPSTDYIFLSNSKRYVQLATALSLKEHSYKVIATSNVTKTNGKFDYTLNYSSLIDEKAEIIDDSFIMLLKVMKKLGVKKILLAGFDGYAGGTKPNYVQADMEYHFTDEQALKLNQYVSDILKDMKEDMDFEFVTDSLYEA